MAASLAAHRAHRGANHSQGIASWSIGTGGSRFRPNVDVNGPPERLLQDLKIDIHKAVDQLIAAERSSLGVFFESIASCCEAGTCNGTDLADAFRSLGRVNDTAILSSSAVKHCIEVPTSGSMPMIEHANIPEEPVFGEPPAAEQQAGPINRLLKSVSALTATMDTATMDIDGGETSFPKSACFTETERKSIHREFVISNENVDTSGEVIKKRPGDLERMFGQFGANLGQYVTDVRAAGPPESKAVDIVEGAPFKCVCFSVILLNMFVIMTDADYAMQNTGKDRPKFVDAFEVFFAAFYFLELLVNLGSYRLYFFLGPDWGWNSFDIIVVGVSMLDLVLRVFNLNAANVSFLRMLRFLKVSRVCRMFHALRIFKEIRVMVDTLAGCFAIFGWCVAMLGLFLSIFAIFFMQGIAAYLESTDNVDVDFTTRAKDMFGSVRKAMLTLLMAMTGGADWGSSYEIVEQLGDAYAWLYLFFILYALFAFSNVIVGVFCEKTLDLSVPSLEEVMLSREKRVTRDAEQLLSLLHGALGDNPDYRLNKKSFNTLLSCPEAIVYFETRGVNVTSARRFFTSLLDVNECDSLDYGTFISACVQFDTSASSIDLYVLGVEMRALQLVTHKVQTSVYNEMVVIRNQVDALQDLCSTFRHSNGVDASQGATSNPSPEFHDRVVNAVREVLIQRVVDFQRSMDTICLENHAWKTNTLLADLKDCAEAKPLLADLVRDLTELCGRMKDLPDASKMENASMNLPTDGSDWQLAVETTQHSVPPAQKLGNPSHCAPLANSLLLHVGATQSPSNNELGQSGDRSASDRSVRSANKISQLKGEILRKASAPGSGNRR